MTLAVGEGRARYDAVVVGSGPNGLAAAIALARLGRSVLVREAAPTIGGGARTAELTLPGIAHDVCSSIHPLGIGSPFFGQLPLADFGVRWLEPPVQLAHPLPDAPAAELHRSVEATAATLGPDGERYAALVAPFVERWRALAPELLGPIVHLPRHPVLLGAFGLLALRSADGLLRSRFACEAARGLLAGIAAHGTIPLTAPASLSFGLVLALAGHDEGWPLVEGGTQRLTDALAAYLRSLGGEIETGAPVRALGELPPARLVFLDVTPRQFLAIAGDRLPAGYRHRLERFRYGPGVFKVDWALSAPVPWTDPACERAGTVHLGGPLAHMVADEAAVWRGEHPERPFVLLAQPGVADRTRAPAGRHILWGYCHVPNGSTVDMTERIERRIEEFAPGFRDVVLARHVMATPALEAYNANYVGGDIAGGANGLRQLLFRPVPSLSPYATPLEGVYLCSSSTPPGGGVHGMCGWHAVRAAVGEG